MPAWSYKCERCGKTTDHIFRNYESMLREVVRCERDGSRCERQVSAPAFSISGYTAANGYAEKQS